MDNVAMFLVSSRLGALGSLVIACAPNAYLSQPHVMPGGLADRRCDFLILHPEGRRPSPDEVITLINEYLESAEEPR